MEQRHFAFRVSYNEIIHAINWLKDRGIEPVESFGFSPKEPIVHTWVP
jgi:lactoylglutathione lyase